ncbi:hypothetical protein Emed_000690 [Eimeria media]
MSALLQRCCGVASRVTAFRTSCAAATCAARQNSLFPAARRDVASVATAAAEAFPFLSQRSSAEASRPGSFGSSAAAVASSGESLRVVRDMEAFEAEVHRQPPQPLAIFFTSKCNTHNKVLLEQFSAIAQSAGSTFKFLVVDVDEVPRAAYHCGVEDACTFVVQYNCDAFRKRIADPLGTKTPQQLVAELRAVMDSCVNAVQKSEVPQQQVEWYSHNIPVDNLNVYRVNWPTA